MTDRSNDPTWRAPDTTPHPRLPYAQFAPGSLVAGRYRIVSLLGSGGMGEVYRADDMKLGQQVALKFLPAAFAHDLAQLDLLHEEVRLGRQVAHPNVCRVYDIGEWDGAHFVAMEYVDGEDLARLLQRIGRLSHDKAVEIARGLAAGLAAAHAKGILHRDLKPANIMIDGRGEPRITDFGLAMTSEESAGSKIVAGTPAYMAPEQLEGKPASVQSDLYALGLILYETFTGRRARIGRTVPGNPYVLASSVFIAAIWTAVTVRVGLLGIATAQTIFNIAFFLTLAIDAPSLLPSTIAPILFILVLTAFAFRTALGSQPMFSARLLDE